jgi:hypothetical protein
MRPGGQPINQLGPDSAALFAAISRSDWPRLARNHQQQPRAHSHSLSQPGIKPRVRRIKRVAVQVERQVGRELRPGQLALPRSIKAMVIQ